MTNYFDIPYEKVVKFITELPKEKRKMLYKKYDIEEPIVYGDNTKSKSRIEQVADLISDDELYKLGYKGDDNLMIIEEESYVPSYSYDQAYELLSNLDEDKLYELFMKYSANNVDDLVLAITDDDLQAIEEIKEGITNASSVSYCPTAEYCEEFDYLEDIPGDIYYIIVNKDNHVYSTFDDVEFNKFKSHLDPNLVEYCETIEDDNIDGYPFIVIPKLYPVEQEEIQEDVVLNKELNQNIFSGTDMKEEVKNSLLEYVNKFVDYLKNKDIELDVQDIALIGSNAGYLYTPKSDIDIHIIIASPIDNDIFDQLKEECDIFEVENPLSIGDNAVELGIEDGYNIIMDNKNPRRYSIINDEWINDSDKNEIYTEDDVTALGDYQKIVDEYTQKIHDVINADEYADAITLKQEIRKNRSDDLANIGSLSMGNVVFKELRNNGSYGELRNYIISKEKDE